MRGRSAGAALALVKKIRGALKRREKLISFGDQSTSPYRNTKSTRHVYRLRWRRRWGSPRARIGSEIEELGHIRHGLVTLRKRGKIEPGFNQLERGGIVHWRMRYEILLGKR